MIPAKIADIRQATPTVKVLTLQSAEPIDFMPGQWVDLYVEVSGIVEIGGYSLTSSSLVRDRVEIAVKRSENPVARYLHDHARVGDFVSIDGGHGLVTYEAGATGHVVLVAGGIGITPLMGILRYAAEVTPEVAVDLLYSAPSEDELVFREEIEKIAGGWPQLRTTYHVTRVPASNDSVCTGRISRNELTTIVDPDALYFVCGPASMIDEITGELRDLGISVRQFRVERWW